MNPIILDHQSEEDRGGMSKEAIVGNAGHGPAEEPHASPMMGAVVYHPIGFVENAFDQPQDPKKMRNAHSIIRIFDRYEGALDGLSGCRFIIVVYHFHMSAGYKERVHPMGDQSIPERGVLSTRSPSRPNPIGITLSEVLSIDGTSIEVTGLDAINGTPVMDIKPYMEHFDSPKGILLERDPKYSPDDAYLKR